jgi:hypothetical protein
MAAVIDDVVGLPGMPLDMATRAFFEPRFGADLSGVRVHTDAAAAGSARSVRALGYAVGRHIVFADGRFRPSSTDGRCLLADQLVHVVQAGAAAAQTVQAPARPPVSTRRASRAVRRQPVVTGPAKPQSAVLHPGPSCGAVAP